MQLRRARGFTVIELFVVIAVIALVISTLLPAIARAGAASRLAQSLTNICQIMAAHHAYRLDHKDDPPMQADGYDSERQIVGGWDTWNYGGKNCDSREIQYWRTRPLDDPAYCRPLNRYTYPGMVLEAPVGHIGAHDGGAHMHGRPSDPDRSRVEMPIYRSPGDRWTCQEPVWPHINTAISAYDDVGTSYCLNMRWWDQPDIQAIVPGPKGFTAAYQEGLNRQKRSSEFDPTGKFVWLHDQVTDAVASASTATFTMMGEFGEVNKSAQAYLDGHAAYNRVTPQWLYDDVGPSAGSQAPSGHAVGRYTLILLAPGQGLPPPR